jgi:hypothetical protein
VTLLSLPEESLDLSAAKNPRRLMVTLLSLPEELPEELLDLSAATNPRLVMVTLLSLLEELLDLSDNSLSDPVDVFVLKFNVVVSATIFLLVHSPGNTLVKPHIVRQLPISLEQSGFIGLVLENHIRLIVLVVS